MTDEDLKTIEYHPEVTPQAPSPSNDDPLLALRRMTIRTTKIQAKRPQPPRELKSVNGRYSWQPPRNPIGITHWNLYRDNELDLVRQVPVKQLFLEDNLQARRVFISSWNATMLLESSRVEIQGTVPPSPDAIQKPGDLLPIGEDPFYVSEAELVNFSDGSQRDRFEIKYNPPDPIGAFTGVKAWVRKPDGTVELAGTHDYQGDGTEGIPGRYGIFNLEMLPPPEDEEWDFFLTTRSASYDEPLVLSGPDATPHVTRTALAAVPTSIPDIPPAPPVTIGTATVREIYVGEFEVTVPWVADSTATPVNFSGVQVHLEDPDTSDKPNAPMDGSIRLDGSTQLSGEWQPKLLLNSNKSPISFRVKGEAAARSLRVYLASYNEVANARLVRANEAGATPSVAVTVPASSVSYISGMEHTWLVTNPVAEVIEDFENPGGAKYRLQFDYQAPDPTIPLPPGLKPFGGVQIVYVTEDGTQARGPVLEANKKESWISPSYDAGNHYFKVAFCSMDVDGAVNTYVKDLTPAVDVQVIYPPTGQGTSPDITNFRTANPRHDYQPDGTIYALVDLLWTPPASNRFAGVKFFLAGSNPPRELGSAAWNASSTELWVIDWPKQVENWKILAIPFDSNGRLSDDPANPSARIPTAWWQIGPPGKGSTGQEYAPDVNIAGVTVTSEQQLSPDGVPMMRFKIEGWQNPNDNNFGGVSIGRAIAGYTDKVVYWDAQKTDTMIVTPWEPAVNSSIMDFYFVSRDMVGQRNSLVPAKTPKKTFPFLVIPGDIIPSRLPDGWWNENEFQWPNYPNDGGFLVKQIVAQKAYVGSILRVGGGNTPTTNASFGGNQNGQIAVYNSSNVIRAWMGQQDNVTHPNEPAHSVFGGWFAELYVGGDSPNNAPLYANNNGVLVLGGFDFISSGATGQSVYPYLSVRDIFGQEKGRMGARLNYGLGATDPYGETIPNISGIWAHEFAFGGQSLADWRILGQPNGSNLYQQGIIRMRNINQIQIDYPAQGGDAPYRMSLGMDTFSTGSVIGHKFPGMLFERKNGSALTGHRAVFLNRGLVCLSKRSVPDVVADQRAAIYSFNGDGSGGDGGANWWGEITLRDTVGNQTVICSGYDNVSGVGPVMSFAYGSNTLKLTTASGYYLSASGYSAQLSTNPAVGLTLTHSYNIVLRPDTGMIYTTGVVQASNGFNTASYSVIAANGAITTPSIFSTGKIQTNLAFNTAGVDVINASAQFVGNGIAVRSNGIGGGAYAVWNTATSGYQWGVDGTFTAGTKTVTVKAGIIISIV